MIEVTQVTEDLKEKLEKISEFTKRVVVVDNLQALQELTNMGKGPKVGIVYMGMAPAASAREGAPQIVVSAEVLFSIMLLHEANVIHPAIPARSEAHQYLDLIRKKVHGQSSPTGHKYKFKAEAPAKTAGNKVVWVIQFSAAVQLTPE